MRDNLNNYRIFDKRGSYVLFDKGHFVRDLNVIVGRSFVEVMAKIYLRRIGLLALFVEPILLAGIYFLLALLIFPTSLSPEFFLSIFASLIVFRGFQKPLESTTVSLVSGSELIRSGVLTAPQIMFGSWFTEVIMGFMVFPIQLIFSFALGFPPRISFLIIPVCYVLSTLFALAFSPILAWLGIAIRGSVAFLLPIISLLWYFTPAIYQLNNVGKRFQPIYSLNPLAQLVQRTKSVYVGTDVDFNLIPILALTFIIFLLAALSVKLFDLYYYRLSKYL